uniref:Uncharacterized protein n=1 Tax=Megaviridae environmental sample TaxID=1737588 RepID=A0A5J6VHC1_9VIRU|nr:MAG: hypothetical protein [Megaviridae environmental sample]
MSATYQEYVKYKKNYIALLHELETPHLPHALELYGGGTSADGVATPQIGKDIGNIIRYKGNYYIVIKHTPGWIRGGIYLVIGLQNTMNNSQLLVKKEISYWTSSDITSITNNTLQDNKKDFIVKLLEIQDIIVKSIKNEVENTIRVTLKNNLINIINQLPELIKTQADIENSSNIEEQIRKLIPSSVEASTTDTSTTEASTTNAPTTDTPATDTSTTDKPTTDKPTTDKPTTNKPTTSDSSTIHNNSVIIVCIIVVTILIFAKIRNK